MNKKTDADAALQMATVRREIITYLENLPRLIQTHGPDSLGSVALNLGKCLLWIGPVLDQFTLVQPLPGQSLPTVTALGDSLREIGLDLIHKPNGGELARTIETLKRQIVLLQKLAVMERGAR